MKIWVGTIERGNQSLEGRCSQTKNAMAEARSRKRATIKQAIRGADIDGRVTFNSH